MAALGLSIMPLLTGGQLMLVWYLLTVESTSVLWKDLPPPLNCPVALVDDKS